MTDLARDPDFVRIYYSGDKEWPGYKTPGCRKFIKKTFENHSKIDLIDLLTDNKNAPLPLLISEIFRLIPYIGSEYVHFHPKNMSDIMIDKVEIIGIVTEKTEMMKYISYIVDDSTGAIPVLSRNKAVRKDRSTKLKGSNDKKLFVYDEGKPQLKPPHGLAPDAPYSYERHIQNLWHCARDEKPLRDEIILYDYVHVLGFCAMTFRNQKDVSQLTNEDIKLGRLFFFGIKVRRISEAQYNVMTKTLITDVATKRYLKLKAEEN